MRAVDAAEIARRLGAMGPAGLLRHLADKLSYIFGDGTFYSGAKLRQAPQRLNLLHRLCLFDFRGFALLEYPVTGCISRASRSRGFAALRRRREAAFLMTAAFGLGLFLLAWEARSRYLVNFLRFSSSAPCAGLSLSAACGMIEFKRRRRARGMRRARARSGGKRSALNGRENETVHGYGDGPRSGGAPVRAVGGGRGARARGRDEIEPRDRASALGAGEEHAI